MTKLHLLNSSSQELWELEENALKKPEETGDASIKTLVLNGPVCQILSAQMPVKQSRQIIKALPFALEEQFANEIDQNHIHYIGREGSEAYALVCEHKEMEKLIKQFNPDRLVYLPLLLPLVEKGICVFIVDDMASIRYSKYGALSVMPEIVPLILDKLKTDDRVFVEYYDLDETHKLLPLEIENIGYEVQQPAYDSLLSAIEKSALSGGENLLSGIYTKKKAPVETKNAKFKAPLAIAASLLVCMFFIQLIEMKQYQTMTTLVKEASESFYVSLFPGERVRSIKRQFRDKLEESGAGPVSSAGFIPLLASATKDINSVSNVEWDAVRFTRQKRELEINLIVDNIAQLDSIKQKMTTNGLLVDIASATNTGKRIKGVLKVRKNG